MTTKTAQIIPFDVEFDCSDMNCEEIIREANRRGWTGIRIDAAEFMEHGTLTIRRLARKDTLLP